MNSSTAEVEAPQPSSPILTYAMAILAPFGSLALVASPLLVDAVRAAIGI